MISLIQRYFDSFGELFPIFLLVLIHAISSSTDAWLNLFVPFLFLYCSLEERNESFKQEILEFQAI